MENSTRFINAFNLIEKELERRLRFDRYIGFVEKVRRLSKSDNTIKRYHRLLEEFSDLRNAIVHERIDGEVIAEPHLKVVTQIEHVAQLLTEPMLIKDRYLRKVDIAFDHQPLHTIAKRMVNKAYSQLPVYDASHRFVGMLSTDSMIRYAVANEFCLDDENITVKDVLPYGKDTQRVAFMDPERSLIEVVNLFEAMILKGQKLHLILITKEAKKDHLPLGVITTHELPEIYEEITE